jgi:dephospho-CoA kinase
VLSVGLTGGIGSGKSEVARRFAERGAGLVDADRIAREVVRAGTPGFDRVVEEFGAEYVGPDGELDRERLGRTVFADESARQRLNAIVHPLVGDRVFELLAQAERELPDGVLVNDVPLLVEGGLMNRYDVIVVVDVPLELQVERLVAKRGMTESDARSRIAAQATRDQRLAVADYVIDNTGDLTALDCRVSDVWAELLARAASSG